MKFKLIKVVNRGKFRLKMFATTKKDRAELRNLKNMLDDENLHHGSVGDFIGVSFLAVELRQEAQR